MGTDIHWINEVKIGGKWHVYSQPRLSRDYEFFGFLAGVRCPERQYFKVRGLPEDVSDLAKIIFEAQGLHTPTYLNLDEIKAVEKWLGHHREITWDFEARYIGYCFGGEWVEESLPDGIEDARFIIGFDS